MKQPHRHTGAPGALIVSITHEPTRGERAPRDGKSSDPGPPIPVSPSRFKPARNEPCERSFRNSHRSDRLENKNHSLHSEKARPPGSVPAESRACCPADYGQAGRSRCCGPSCMAAKVFTCTYRGHHSRTQVAFRRLHVSWLVWWAVKDCLKGRADRSFATTHSSRDLTQGEQRSGASPSCQRPGGPILTACVATDSNARDWMMTACRRKSDRARPQWPPSSTVPTNSEGRCPRVGTEGP